MYSEPWFLVPRVIVGDFVHLFQNGLTRERLAINQRVKVNGLVFLGMG